MKNKIKMHWWTRLFCKLTFHNYSSRKENIDYGHTTALIKTATYCNKCDKQHWVQMH